MTHADNTVYSSMHICCCGNMFTELFSGSSCLFLLIKNLLPSNGHHFFVCFVAVA
jgi:hypothetical protein